MSRFIQIKNFWLISEYNQFLPIIVIHIKMDFIELILKNHF